MATERNSVLVAKELIRTADDSHYHCDRPCSIADVWHALGYMQTTLQQPIMNEMLQEDKRVGKCFAKILGGPPMSLEVARQLCSLRVARLQRAFRLEPEPEPEPKSLLHCNQVMQETQGSPFNTKYALLLPDLPVELLDLIINSLDMSDLKSMRLTSCAFNKLTLEHYKSSKKRLAVRIWYDADLPRTALKLWESPIWREITRTVILELPRTKQFYEKPHPSWDHSLQECADLTESTCNNRHLRLMLQLITSLPNLQRLTFVHNTMNDKLKAIIGGSVLGKDTPRSKAKEGLLTELDEIMKLNLKHGLLGISLGLATTEVREYVHHYVFRR
ncbi:hypothetical protein E8E13_008787 [Curvularia kusanoi]|uniref:F-box domain-containing protein n=1 Tax=Curvularia kusanoi TaxID=90978 RepID=A0A9P4TBH2_CURKU|nr:hypothetical protein E8E13_008787 [Curvularia kusanoi]